MTQDDDGLRWDDMKLLLALSRTGSLSGAGARLGLNTSTVGRRLDALEASVGLHLFDRGSSGVLATEAAEALLPAAEAMERAAADALRTVAGRETEPEGTVRVTAPPGFASLLVAPALVRLCDRHPRLRVQLDAAVGYADLTRREADLALRLRRPESGDLVSRLVGEAELVPIAGTMQAEAAGRVRDLAELRWITWGDELSHLPDARWIAGQVPAERVVLRTGSVEAQLRAIESGLGVGLHPHAFARAARLAPLRLAPALVKRLPPWPSGQVWLVSHRALRQVPRVAVVWEFLLAELTAIFA
jgi:DNA-binding transcriptional LysR family regulator